MDSYHLSSVSLLNLRGFVSTVYEIQDLESLD